jgi:hypothetical protein
VTRDLSTVLALISCTQYAVAVPGGPSENSLVLLAGGAIPVGAVGQHSPSSSAPEDEMASVSLGGRSSSRVWEGFLTGRPRTADRAP